MYVKSEKKWLSRKEAAVFLTQMGCTISHRTLQKIAYLGDGPPYIRSGWRTVAYDIGDLTEWANSKIIKFK